MEKDLAVYLLVRTDLPSMGDGKGKAQSHHAGFQLASKYKSHPLVKEYIALGEKGGADHFNTTITMECNINDINRIIKEARKQKFLCDIIIDPTYPFVVNDEIADLISPDKAKIVKLLDDNKMLMTREEVTVAYALGDRNDPNFKGLFAELKLYPDKL